MAGLWQLLQVDQGGELEHWVTAHAPSLWDTGEGSTAPTVVLYGPDGTSELVASQEATTGPSTTVGDGGVTAGATSLPVVDTSDLVVGRQYLIGPSAALGQWEFVTVHAISPSTEGEGEGDGEEGEVTVRDALQYSYAEEDAFRSHRLSVSITGAEVPTVYRRCHARWTYEVGGVEIHETTLFSISTFSPRCPLTEQDVISRQSWAENLIGSRQRLNDLIGQAWEELLDELAVKVDPGAVVAGASLKLALRERVLADLALVNNQADRYALHWDRFEAMWDRVLRTPIDVDGDGAITEDDQVPPLFVSRLRRAG